MNYSVVRAAIWYVGTGLEAYLVALVFWRRLFKPLPLFSVYACYVFVWWLGMWLVRGEGALYYWSYWIGQLVALVLTYLVIMELYSRVFQAYPFLRTVILSVLITVLGALILSSVLLTRTDPHWMRRWLLLLERSVRFTQVGLLLLFFAAAYYFALRLDARVRAVGIGFAIYTTVELANFALVSYFYYHYERFWDLLSASSYMVTLAVWAIGLTASAPETAREVARPASGPLVELESAIRKRMEEINRALWGILRGRLF